MGLGLEVRLESSATIRTIAGTALTHVGVVSGAERELVFVATFGVFGRAVGVGREGEVGHRGLCAVE